jgi:hypothetical protein
MGLLEIKGPDKLQAQRFNWRSKKNYEEREEDRR